MMMMLTVGSIGSMIWIGMMILMKIVIYQCQAVLAEVVKNQKYVIKDTDKTSVSKEKLRQIEGTKQSTTNSCVSAGIVISSMLFDVSLSESVVINEIFNKELAADPKNALSILNGEYNIERLPGEIISIFESQKISAHDIGGVNGIQDALKNNEVVMTTQFYNRRRQSFYCNSGSKI